MNVLCSQLKYVPTVTKNLVQFARGYAAPKSLPIEWVRPPKILSIAPEKSGDGGLDLKVSPDDYMIEYRGSKELENASDIVKKMFTVGFNRQKEYFRVEHQRTLGLVQRHKHDRGSIEAKVASMTIEILKLQKRFEIYPTDKKAKVYLKELIEKRKKIMKKLRVHDYARFEFLLERLNLIYHPFPEENPRIYRKDSTKKLLNKYCDELTQQKLDEYKNELELQKKDFYKEKLEKLKFIRNEEIACGVTPTITEKEIEAAEQKVSSFE